MLKAIISLLLGFLIVFLVATVTVISLSGHRAKPVTLHLTNRTTQNMQRYRIDALDKRKQLRLHAVEGYDLVFTGELV